MNDEIKEIEQRLKLLHAECNPKAREEDIGYTIDYITNLQEENENLYETVEQYLKSIDNLQQENETLKTANDYLQDKLNELEKSTNYNYYHSENVKLRRENSILTDYKSRCEKASEYINHAQNYGTMAQVMPHLKHYVNGDDLLNILQNGSDSQ